VSRFLFFEKIKKKPGNNNGRSLVFEALFIGNFGGVFSAKSLSDGDSSTPAFVCF